MNVYNNCTRKQATPRFACVCGFYKCFKISIKAYWWNFVAGSGTENYEVDWSGGDYPEERQSWEHHWAERRVRDCTGALMSFTPVLGICLPVSWLMTFFDAAADRRCAFLALALRCLQGQYESPWLWSWPWSLCPRPWLW